MAADPRLPSFARLGPPPGRRGTVLLSRRGSSRPSRSRWWSAMRMTIVRHALARDKKSWRGPDLERPLDPVGERQAAGMAPIADEAQGAAHHLEPGHPMRSDHAAPRRRRRRADRAVGRARTRRQRDADPHGASPIPSITTPSCAPTARSSINSCWSTTCDGLARRGRLSKRRLLIKGSAWRLEITTSGRVSKLNHVRPTK